MKFTNIKYIFLKELRSFFNSPVAYIVIVGYLIWLGIFFTSNLFVNGQSTLREVFDTSLFLLLFFAPVMAMRLIAEEKKTGTLEWLVTKPVKEYEIITGKFLATWALYFFTLLPTLSYFITVAVLGRLDIGAVLCGYLGLLLVGAVFLAISIFGSSITENQIIAVIVSFGIIFTVWMVDRMLIYIPPPLAGLVGPLEYIGINYHFSNIARGVIDSRDIIYYASAIGFALFMATTSLQKRRWA